MGTIIDRRFGDRNKNLNNRNKFLRRIDEAYREGVRKLVNDSNIEDLLSDKKKKISIPGKGLETPQFVFKKSSGVKEMVTTGNDRFKKGDPIPKPPGGRGYADDEGESGEGNAQGNDSFSFVISKDEYLDILFEELELPDMIKKQMSDVESTTLRRAGFTTTGIPVRMNIVRSVKQAKGRKLAFTIAFQNRIAELEKRLEELVAISPTSDDITSEINLITEEIESLRNKIEAIPYLQESDLRFSRFEVRKAPITKAVMFAIMDVSGSMGQWDKEMAKRFFLLLALFLEREYEHMDIVWIIHTDQAWQVTSKEFFESSMNGGTYASSAFALMKKIIEEKYDPTKWNIFAAQLSDGDNAMGDMPEAMKLLTQDLLPIIQYFAYAETRKGEFMNLYSGSTLYTAYKDLEQKFKNLKSHIITDVTTIYPIFRKLFEKKR